MQGINTRIGVTDGMSPALRTMNRALDAVISSFDKLQQATDSAVDVTEIENARKELTRSAREVNRLTDELGGADSKASRLGSTLNGILGTLISISTIKAVTGWIGDSLGLADTQTNAENQLNAVLKNMGGTEASYQAILNKASEIQRAGIYGDEAMIAGAAELATYFTDSNAITTMMDTLSNYAMGMTGGGEVDARAMVDYATGLGKIMTGSYESMTKKGFEFTDVQKAIIDGTATQQQIAEELGEEYLKMSQDMQAVGAISNVINESWGDLYTTMSNTPQGAIISLKNKLGDMREELALKIYPSVEKIVNVVEKHAPAIEKIIDAFASGLSTMLDFISLVANGLLTVADIIMDNWAVTEPIIFGVATALAVYEVNALAATIAQEGFNLALDACPLLAVISLIMIAISALSNFSEQMNRIGEDGLTPWAKIVGGVMVVVAAINNACETIYLVTQGVSDAVQYAFEVATSGVIDTFINLYSTVSQIILSIAQMLNALPFVDFDLSGLQGAASTYTNHMAEKEYANFNSSNFRAIGDMWTSGWADQAYNMGVYSVMKDIWDAQKDDTPTFEIPEISISDDLDSIAGDVGSIAKSLNASDEMLTYLRDIAEREAVNRFTTAEIKLDMTNNNTINGDNDIDSITDKLTRNVKEAMMAMAQGAY